ncbi:Uncharacterised protein [uncultured archaeon]|nr:Uncharacterised protein [uncultured archaeon]
MTEYKIQSNMNENNILFHQIVRDGKPLCIFAEGYPFKYVTERKYLLDAVERHARLLKNSAIKSIEKIVEVEE